MHIDGTVASTGELTDQTMRWGPGGTFEITVSANQQRGNWLRMEPDTNFLLVRQTLLDRKMEIPGSFHIERIGNSTTPVPLDTAFLEAALMRTASFVAGNSQKFADWLPIFQKNTNQMADVGQEWFWKQGGDSLFGYLWGYFKIAADEAWVLDFIPPAASYWSFSLYNCWVESFDYRHLSVALNNHEVKLNPDGSVTLVIAARDRGVGNWLDTAGHTEAMALFRGKEIAAVPEVKCRVAKLSDLNN